MQNVILNMESEKSPLENTQWTISSIRATKPQWSFCTILLYNNRGRKGVFCPRLGTPLKNKDFEEISPSKMKT